MKMKLTENQMRSILWREDIEGFDYELIEKSEWEVEDKYQTCEVIFKHNDKFYSFYAYRTGNYYQGYETEFWDDEALEVTKKAYTSYRWIQVKVEENPPESVSCYSEE